ncbi:MAG TPA: cation:proton antiporter [Rhodanobacteraceae bacterium]|nr:cation:proton antiporter [Rhodanobacteraceae bacterium]
MHDIGFIRDLAIVMLVAGATTVIFQRLRLPALLGYILAGMLIGPHTPGPLVADERAISDIADLGVVLLMFTLGLEFNIGKLRRVGSSVLLVAVAEVSLMLALGFEIGRLFGFSRTDSLFLGAAMSLSSTMIALRMIEEIRLSDRPFVRTVVGLLITEDVLSVVLMTLLTAVAAGGTLVADAAFSVIWHLLLFVLVGLLAGLLLLPRLLNYVASFKRDEMLLVVALGICFGASLLASWFGFSVALGAFLAGAVCAESEASARIKHLVEPLRDMFAALFFVAIGLMIDPQLLLKYALPAALVAASVIGGKLLFCAVGAFVAGRKPRESLRSGFTMAQIGEFSFVIASIGMSMKATGESVYPIVVAASVICMTVSPQLLRHSDHIADLLSSWLPTFVKTMARSYADWISEVRPLKDNAIIAAMFRRLLWHIAVNVALVVALFVAGAYINAHDDGWFARIGINGRARQATIWASALFLSLPMLIAVYRKSEALGMLLAELGISEKLGRRYTHTLRAILARIIPLSTLLLLAAMVNALGSTILPPRGVALAIGVTGLATALFLWRSLVKLHARFQGALRDTIERPRSSAGD